MTLSKSLHSYVSELNAFDRAKASTKGIRIEFPTRGTAAHYQARLHYCRVLDRQENTRALPPESPLYNKSDYDDIKVCIREDVTGSWWVYLEKNEVIPGVVEEL